MGSKDIRNSASPPASDFILLLPTTKKLASDDLSVSVGLFFHPSVHLNLVIPLFHSLLQGLWKIAKLWSSPF